MKIVKDGSSANSDTQSSRSWADDTTYYMELKNDGTQLLHQRYTDSTYSTVAETGNLSDDKGGDYTTGLRYVIFGGTDTGANQGGYTAKITNLDVYPNGVLNPLSLSLDSSLNMEGTNSAVFDGSNNYMTISGTNTILPTTGAWMMGANIKLSNVVEEAGEPCGDIEIQSSELTGVDIEGEIIPRVIDEIPILALAACFAKGQTIIKDAEELRIKESDRISATVNGLSKLGATLTETNDGMVISGNAKLIGAPVDTFNDHRIAMTMGIAGVLADGTTEINRSEANMISYPSFWEQLSIVTGELEVSAH